MVGFDECDCVDPRYQLASDSLPWSAEVADAASTDEEIRGRELGNVAFDACYGQRGHLAPLSGDAHGNPIVTQSDTSSRYASLWVSETRFAYSLL